MSSQVKTAAVSGMTIEPTRCRMPTGIATGFGIATFSLFLLALPRTSSPAESGQSLAQQAQLFQSDQNYAVLVGVKNYPTWGGLRPLDWSDKDITGLQTALQSLKYHVLPPLIDSDALKGSIEATLTALGRSLSTSEKKAATLVFFFSGHGWGVGGKNYLATFDARSKALAQSGLSVDELQGMLTRTGVRRILLIIDACRSDPSIAKDVSDTSLAEFREAEGVRILFATRVGDFSYENASLRHGVFSYFLIDALSGKARDPNGYLTSDSVFEYVSQNVRRFAREHSLEQAPFEGGEHTYERFLLAPPCPACAIPPVPGASVPPPAVYPTPAPVAAAVSAPAEPMSREARLVADGGYCGRLRTLAQWSGNLWKGEAPAFTKLHFWTNSSEMFEVTSNVDAKMCRLSREGFYKCLLIIESGTRVPSTVVKSRVVEVMSKLTECFGPPEKGAALAKAFPTNLAEASSLPTADRTSYLLGTWKSVHADQPVYIDLVADMMGTADTVLGSWGWMTFELTGPIRAP
jgi:hypothetical protein